MPCSDINPQLLFFFICFRPAKSSDLPNPFANTLLTKPTSNNPFSQLSIPIPSSASTAPSASALSGSNKTISATERDDKMSKASENEYDRKMAKLNMNFGNWLNQQMSEQPLSLWKNGVQVRRPNLN